MDDHERIYRAAAAKDWQDTAEIAELAGLVEDFLLVATTLHAGILDEEVERHEADGIVRWRITPKGVARLPRRPPKAAKR